MIEKVCNIIKKAKQVTVFTGAGISVESGIPPFRGKNGLWAKFDPIFLDLNYFHKNPAQSWKLIKQIFYDFFGKAKPNHAHSVLAKMEQNHLIHDIITQNIDNLHQEAGSQNVYEFHGTAQRLICTGCQTTFSGSELKNLIKIEPYPVCPNCQRLLKPDFVFFGEPIPKIAYSQAIEDANSSDVFLLIGTTGEIQPASSIPLMAKQNNAIIIEINISPSNYTKTITDFFLQGKATEILKKIEMELGI